MTYDLNSISANEYLIYEKEGYIQVHSNGVKNMEFVTTVWTEVVKACQAKNMYRILGVALTSHPLSMEEAKGLLPLFQELGLDNTYKIAWVELNPEFYETCLFSESLLFTNGVNAKFFYEVEHARNWLLREE